MHAARVQIRSPEFLVEALRDERMSSALSAIAQLAGAELHWERGDSPRDPSTAGNPTDVALHYQGKSVGQVRYEGNSSSPAVASAARAMASILEHLVDREAAIGDLAEEMIASYEELNMLYALLPNVATSVHPTDIGHALVDETVRTLQCRRVSLLVVDESAKNLRVLASRGLPPEARNVVIPIGESVAGRILTGDESMLVGRMSLNPDLAELSKGHYDTDSFAVVRVMLRARGETLGVLTATERCDDAEFTARDRKLLEGLAAIGATSLLNCRLHHAINRQMITTIRALASAIDAKDRYTHAHSARVAQMAVATARRLDIHDAEALREVELAGLLHDIGKIGISDSLLTKEGRLTPQEFSIVQKHAEIGAKIVEHVQGLERVARAIRHHHERFDGLGYPDGLEGENIPRAARLISVADVFDCLTSDRSYRKASPHDQAIAELVRNKGTQLDPAVVDAFLAVISSERHHPTTGDRVGSVLAETPA